RSLAQDAVLVSINPALVKIEHCPPDGVISMPVARTDRALVGISEYIGPQLPRHPSNKAASRPRQIHNPPDSRHQAPLRLPLDIVFSKLISTFARRPPCMMREPVLIAADSYHALQPRRYAALFVRLELRYIDHHVGTQKRVCNAVLVTRSLVVLVRLRHVVFR